MIRLMNSLILNFEYSSSYQWNMGDILQTIVVSITTDIASYQSGVKILVYPNSTKDLVNIE